MQNFYLHQEKAKRNTSRLVFFFVFALILITVLVYAMVVGLYVGVGHQSSIGAAKPSYWQPMLLLACAFGVGVVVGGASLYKVAQLSEGGKSVALMLGGTEISQSTRDWREKRIINIVEEMAIASGVPIPPVYLLPDEAGINAFAAGHTTGDAVVAVSQGCIDYLTRDELQGVVAHEFSHILNGDMRLNIRLMAVIHGLMFMSIIGYYLMRTSGSSDSSSSRDSKGSGQLIVLGLGIMILGWLGSIFGQLIQAAVSRQREFLADASAVQFTRNPYGISGALKKIGGVKEGSHIKNPEGQAVNHMFFAAGVSHFSDALASHPPLPERIRRLDPQWDGEYPVVRKLTEDDAPGEKKQPGKMPQIMPGGPSLPGMPQLPIPVVLGLADQSVAGIGTMPDAAVESAGVVSARIPQKIRAAAEDAFSARTLIYCLLLDSNTAIRDKQLRMLDELCTPEEVNETLRLEKHVRELDKDLRLPAAQIAIPALRQMSKKQYAVFMEEFQKLIDADGELSLLEYAVSALVKHYLRQSFEPRSRPIEKYTAVKQIAIPLTTVLSRVAYEGTSDDAAAAAAFATGMQVVAGDGISAEICRADECTLAEFDRALKMLKQATLPLKEKVIRACAGTILADDKITTRESDLLRVICALLDCPMPLQDTFGQQPGE